MGGGKIKEGRGGGQIVGVDGGGGHRLQEEGGGGDTGCGVRGGGSSPHCFLTHPPHVHTTHCDSLHEPGVITTTVRSSASWKLSGLCLKLA